MKPRIATVVKYGLDNCFVMFMSLNVSLHAQHYVKIRCDALFYC